MKPHNPGAFYLKTLVSLEEDGLLVPADESTMARDRVVHVIAAWSPGNERPTQDENDSANRRVLDLLVERGLQPVRAIGAAPDLEHAAESWAVVGLDDHEARSSGASFGQVAVFRIADGVQTVLSPPPADPSCAHPESSRPE